MGQGKKSKKSKHSSSRNKGDDPETARPTSGSFSPAKVPAPIIVGFIGLQLIFGIVFVIVGSLNINKCKIEPMIPIWLILMGIVYVITAAHEFYQYRSSIASPNKGRSFLAIIVTGIVTLLTVALFIAGNVFVYRAWGEAPDYGHYWFYNGCNMSAYMLAFVGVIVMDAVFGLMLLGVLFYAAFSCFA